MPHAEVSKVNGTSPSSQTLDVRSTLRTYTSPRSADKVSQHITSYPAVKESIDMYQQNPYGARSISLFQQLYNSLAGPLGPYLQTPYSILAPYLQKADALGNNALHNADERFPAIKNADMQQVKTSAFDVAKMPFQFAGIGRDYLFDTYKGENKKCGGGNDVVTVGKSIICTELRIVSDAMVKVGDYFNVDKEQVKRTAEKAKKTGINKAEEAKGAVQNKADQITK